MKRIKKHIPIIVVTVITIVHYVQSIVLFPDVDAYVPLIVLGDYYELTVYGCIFLAIAMIVALMAGMIIGIDIERKRN